MHHCVSVNVLGGYFVDATAVREDLDAETTEALLKAYLPYEVSART